ncbi:nucleotidyltransferase family protein [Pedobacter antarcticus]|nr:nucleotidyltransferase family protein [Pedobacter antarcticus]
MLLLVSLFMPAAVQNKHTLVSLLKANSQKLRSYGVSKVSIFGSFITGKLNAESDVDLLVDFNPDQKSYDNFMDLSFFLEDLLGRKVEVVTPQSLSKYIGSHILEQAENVAI